MTITEALSVKRRTYWENVIDETNNRLKKYLLQYQVDEDFISRFYKVSLVVKFCGQYEVDVRNPLRIYVKINNELVDYEDGDCLESFKCDVAIRRYLELLSPNILDGEGTVTTCNSDFDVRIMREVEEVVILEVVLELID